jgi:hypothetical protein
MYQLFIVCRICLCAFTVCNTCSFFIRSVQTIFSIVLQHQIKRTSQVFLIYFLKQLLLWRTHKSSYLQNWRKPIYERAVLHSSALYLPNRHVYFVGWLIKRSWMSCILLHLKRPVLRFMPSVKRFNLRGGGGPFVLIILYAASWEDESDNILRLAVAHGDVIIGTARWINTGWSLLLCATQYEKHTISEVVRNIQSRANIGTWGHSEG